MLKRFWRGKRCLVARDFFPMPSGMYVLCIYSTLHTGYG